MLVERRRHGVFLFGRPRRGRLFVLRRYRVDLRRCHVVRHSARRRVWQREDGPVDVVPQHVQP